MATDLERLVVQMSADFKSYENAFAKATGVTRQQLAIIKADAANTGKATEVAFTGASRGVQRFGQQAQASGRGVQNLRLQTANLGAQFQDIAVQLQSGTSPFTIALQQGTQISSVLGGAGAGGAVKALGAALASIVSPTNLVIIGLIAAGGAAVQYFSSLLGGSDKSAKELERQADLIQQVAKEWEGAIPFVEEYAAAVARAADAEKVREAGELVIATMWKDAPAMVEQFEQALVAVKTQLDAVGDTAGLAAVQKAFSDLQQKVEDHAATGKDAEAVQAALNATTEAGTPLVDDLAAALGPLAGALDAVAANARSAKIEVEGAVGALARFRASEAMRQSSVTTLKDSAAINKTVNDEIERRNTLTEEQIQLEDRAAAIQGQFVDRGGFTSIIAATELAKEQIAAEKARADAAKAASSSGGGGGGGGGAAKNIDREREAVTKLIEQLNYESTLIGKTAVEKEKMNALRRAGAAATPEETAEIQRLVEANYAEIEALQQTEDQMNRLKDVSRDVLGGIFEDLRDGVAAADLLNNALNRVIESMTQAALDQFIEGVFAGQTAPATGGIGGIIGSIFGARHHTGGVAGKGGYMNRAYPAAMWANAPKFHSGGEVPALLLPGERVLSKRESAGYGGDVTVQVFNAPAGTQVQESKGPDGKRLIKVMLKPALQELMSDGSMDGTMRSNFGVRRRPR